MINVIIHLLALSPTHIADGIFENEIRKCHKLMDNNFRIRQKGNKMPNRPRWPQTGHRG